MSEYMSDKKSRAAKASVLSSLKKKGKKKLQKERGVSAVPNGFDEDDEPESVAKYLSKDTDKVGKASKPNQIHGRN